MMQPDPNQLEDLLSYENEDMLSRFTDMYAMNESEAQEIMQETLKFIYISQIPGTFIPDDLLIIDEMWHNMILFTPQYHEFSERYFQRYFHHIPASKAEKQERKKQLAVDADTARQNYLKKLEVLISITYDHLGEQTVKKWFQEYPEKYSKERIKALRK
ncbi:glycine-rich domain-containing protein [Marinoscillum furvescens]|nr:hypothetical protein [Marinoscillum furvescens]